MENELKTLSEMKKVNLIDEYKDEYDQVVAEIKQLDTQYLVSGQQNEEEYKKKRIELNQKKTDYNRLFEEQMQRDENLPSHIEHLEKRLKALNFQINNLQMEVEDERHVVNYHMDFNKKTGDSLISCLDDCKTEVKQYAESITSVSVIQFIKFRTIWMTFTWIHSHLKRIQNTSLNFVRVLRSHLFLQ